MTGGKWGDAAGKPDPRQLVRQGFEGLFLYFGTPQYAKNCTPAYYQAVRAAGLDVIGVVEHDAHDAELGAAAGASYAQAGLADMAAQGALGWPLGVTADEHLTAGQIPTAMAFQAAASRVIRAARRLAMGYGFMEFIHALRPGGLVDIEWQAGSRSLVDGRTHFWQDNTGTEMVGPVQVDRDYKLREYPVTAPDPNLDAFVWIGGTSTRAVHTDADLAPAGIDPTSLFGRVCDIQFALTKALPALQATLTSLQGALTADEATMVGLLQGADSDTKAGVLQVVAAIAAVPAGGQVDVKTLAVALAPLLPVDATPAAIGEAVVAALEAHLAAAPPTGGTP
jgi:hypothetical protein